MSQPSNQAASPILRKIQMIYPEMTKGQQKIADYILANPSEVTHESITDLRDHVGIKSEASIVKFYRLIGFSGFKEFKLQMAQELASVTFYHNYDEIQMSDDEAAIWRKIHQGAITTLQANTGHLDSSNLSHACQMIRSAGRIVFVGYAASAALCYYAFFRFIELGYNCHFSADSHINAALLSHPMPNDLIFCISHSGETKDLIEPLESIDRKLVNILVMTSNPNSTLAGMADLVIDTMSDETTVITDAMNSRTAQICAIDALFSIVSISKGEDALKSLMATRQTFRSFKKKPSQ